MALLTQLRKYASRHHMFSPGDRVGIAVSGGADSVCLLRLLLELRSELGLVLRVVHFDHQLRPESAQDAEFSAQLAQRHGCEFHLGNGDVRRHATEHRQSIETAARNLRYEYFDSLLRAGTVTTIATAHTQTDQAETVLMKLLRGAGAQGLAGIHPVLAREHGAIVRPLLFASRVEIEQHLQDIAQAFRTDASNADTTFTRNRVRHELMPKLREFNPEADAALAQTAEILREEDATLQVEAERALPFVLMQGEPVRGGGRAAGTHTDAAFALSLESLSRYPVGLQRRLVRAAAKHWCTLSLADTMRILDLAGQTGATNKWIQLEGGIQVRRLHRELQFQQVVPSVPDLPEPTLVEAEFTGTSLNVASLRIACAAARPLTSAQVIEVILPVRVRVRSCHAGDRYFAPHTRRPKKLKEHLQRLKLSAEQRANWPVLEIETAVGPEIVWVRGLPARTVRLHRADPDAEYVGNLFVEETEA